MIWIIYFKNFDQHLFAKSSDIINMQKAILSLHGFHKKTTVQEMMS